MMATKTTSYNNYHQKIFLDALRCGDTMRLRRILETDLPGEGEPGLIFDTPKQQPLNHTVAYVNEPLMSSSDGSVNVNVYSSDGQTALHQSCRTGNLELVKLLISRGADVRLANRDGWSALHIAVGAGHSDVARYLIRAHQR